MRVCVCVCAAHSCWSPEATDRPSVDMLLECLDLMIEDRQQQHDDDQQQQPSHVSGAY
jgi:hypothetical protein